MKTEEIIPALREHVAQLRQLRSESNDPQRVFNLGNRLNDVLNALRLLERSLRSEDFGQAVKEESLEDKVSQSPESDPGLETKKVKAPHERVQAKGRRKSNS